MEEDPTATRTATRFARAYFLSTFVIEQVGFFRLTFSSAAAWSPASTSIFMTGPPFVLMVNVKRIGCSLRGSGEVDEALLG
jgi:hypothetical protein